MKVINKRPNKIFFPYAGRGRRGVDLGPGEASPEMPPSRMDHPQLQADLNSGKVELQLSPRDKVVLRGNMPDQFIDSAIEEVPAAPVAVEPPPPPEPVSTEPEPIKVVEKKSAGDKVMFYLPAFILIYLLF